VSTAFLKSINRILGIEGGYVNNAADPGGETNWGISKRSYPNLDIATLTRDEAIAIYERDFWNKINGDDLPPGVGYQCMDFAVNSGVGTALRALQRAVGVADDGVFGPASLAALKAQDAADTIMRFVAERLMFMSGLSAWPSFGRGWARRIATDLRYGAQDTP
jgi:lysozyme family protein